MNILYFHTKNPDASKHVRVIEPLSYLCKRGHQATSFESLLAHEEKLPWSEIEKALSKCDILLISNVDIIPESFALFQRMVDYCNRHKKLVIYDFDDIYDQVPKSNPNLDRTLTWDFLKTTIPLAHAITVTGKDLQKALLPYHPRVFILPNMIDFEKFQPRPRKSPMCRVGWAGGISHLEDLALIIPCIKALQTRYPFKFFVFGMFNQTSDVTVHEEIIKKNAIRAEELTNPFHRAFTQFVNHMDGVRYELIPAVAYSEFPHKLASLDLDIGLCPIHDTLFNRCRSGIKFYQYAAVHTATIASNIYPYSEEPAILVENTPQAWTNAIESLFLNKNILTQTIDFQHQHVRKTRNYKSAGIAWDHLYQELLKTLH